MKRTYTVKEAAEASGVTVRTLHHYDEIGLLKTDRSAAGYRLYGEAEMLRLQQILIGRALGLSLEDIRRALDDPKFDHAQALRRQRKALLARLSQTHAMIAAIDSALTHLETGQKTMDLKTLFDGFDPSAHEVEAKERWGETDAWKENAKRTRKYGEAEWRAIKAEADAIWSDAAAAMASGAASEGPLARALAERHRMHIDRWFYPCSPEMHGALADMWESDPRFAANIDRHGAGLTAWIAQAVRAAAA